MRKAGDLHYLPARTSGLLPDRERHPHAVLFDERPPSVPAVVFGTKSRKERDTGASHVVVAPRTAYPNPNGLRYTTHFYPGVIYRPAKSDLGRAAGSVALNLGAIRAEMRNALGIRSGRAGDPGVPASSLRGAILQLHKDRCGALQTEWAVSLTEHAYSGRYRYHALVPVYASLGGTDENGIVYSTGEPWVPQIFPHHDSARLLAPLVHSVWCDYAVRRVTDVIVDASTMARLEDAVCAFLEC
ncbi:MAG TPA: hypothetical protein VGB92_03025 [Longimicrobium sp.]|jgi:hypothetical protein